MSAPLNLELAFADLVASLQSFAEPRRPRVENGEFVLIAGFPTGAITTNLRRPKRLVHFEHASLSVWRRTPDGPAVLARVSSWTKCNRWIKFATRASLYAYADVCEQCARALKEAGQQVPMPAVDF